MNASSPPDGACIPREPLNGAGTDNGAVVLEKVQGNGSGGQRESIGRNHSLALGLDGHNNSGPDASITRVPISFAQQRLWFLEQLNPGTAVYNMAQAVRIRGTVRKEALDSAFASVLNRHEVLRTVIANEEGNPVGLVISADGISLQEHDLTFLPLHERERSQNSIIQRQSQRPFDLEKDLMVRMDLIRLSNEECLLLVIMHHIASDAASFPLFFQELWAFYESADTGENLPDRLPMQYSDYAAAQQNAWLRGECAESLEYWKTQLADLPDRLELPADTPVPAVRTFAGEQISMALEPELATALRTLASGERVTTFILLLAAFQVLLHRLSGQDDLVVGAPITGRDGLELQHLIGFFINTIPLRARFAENPSFRQFLRQSRSTCLQAYAHADVPFEKLVEEIRPGRMSGSLPLLQVFFAHEVERAVNKSGPDLSIQPVQVGTGTAKFDLMLTARESGDVITLELEYSSELFSPGSMKRWLGHLQVLLRGIIADPSREVDDLPLLSDAELHLMLHDWNDTTRPYPRELCLNQIFEHQASERPAAIALVSDIEQLTYAELNARGNSLARALRNQGVHPGQTLAICLGRSPALIVAILGALKAGAAYAPLDPTWPPVRIEQMLLDLGSPIVITSAALSGTISALQTSQPAGLKVLAMDSQWDTISRLPGSDLVCEAAPANVAYISFTSGSTGTPKGVRVLHRGIVRLVSNNHFARFSADQVFLHMAPASFDGSLFEIWGPLLNGGKLVLPPPHLPSLSELRDLLRKNEVTCAWFTVGLFNQIIDEAPDTLLPLQHIITGGDVLSPAHIAKALRLLPRCRFTNGYGPTENTTFTTTYEIPAEFRQDRPVPIGRPISNTECYILDRRLRPVPIGVTGEIFAGGDGLADGYLNAPDLTAEKFIPHPWREGDRLYRTGDLGRYNTDGTIEFLGRRDHQVKVRGFRVEVSEIEAVLSSHPRVKSCCVTTFADACGTKQLVAYYVPEAQAPSHAELSTFCRERLPDFMIPAALVELRNLPLSANGKVDRRALPKPAFNSSTETTGRIPADEMTLRLVQIWESVLDVRPVGQHQNFFALGGHSLLAVRLIARLEKELQRRLPVSTLFENPTVAEMKAALKQLEPASGPARTILAIQPCGSKPPLMLVHGAGGGMLWGYSNLARYLGAEQPLFVFSSRGLNGQDELPTIEALAESYLQALKEHQPHGPYYLGGYCFGGLVAYEMAGRLLDRGEEVALLAMINTSPPNSSYTQFRRSPASYARFCANFLRKFRYLAPGSLSWGDLLRWKARRIGSRLQSLRAGSQEAVANADDPEEWQDLAAYSEDQRRVWATHIRALSSYRPRNYPGRVTLFRSPLHLLYCSYDHYYGWREFVTGGVDLKIIPGAHDNIMADPRVQDLANALAEVLNREQGFAV